VTRGVSGGNPVALVKARERSVEARYKKSEVRREQFKQLVIAGCTVGEAMGQIGLSATTYAYWRKTHPRFAAEVDAIRQEMLAADDERQLVHQEKIGFAEARLRFFGMSSPPFQLEVINAAEAMTPGQILMVLFHPSAGKTALYEDEMNWRLGIDPAFRTTIGMNKIEHARQVLGTIKDRMEPGAGYDDYIAWGGPFREIGTDRRRQKWTETAFNVARKPLGNKRDASVRAVGIKSSVASIRTDRLHGDDLQDKNSRGQTNEIEDRFRQDWLSRPAQEGTTTIYGNRVEEDDFYERLAEDPALTSRRGDRPPIMRVIKLPAIVKEPDPVTGQIVERPLSPWFTLEGLEDMAAKVGPDAWLRNWMQTPELVGRNVHFKAEVIDACKDVQLWMGPRPGQIVWVGLDPGIKPGITALTAFDVSTGKLILVDQKAFPECGSNEDIMERLEEMVVRCELAGAKVMRVVIEAMNFQRGLQRDERLKRLAELHGFETLPHMTGINKYDENIGILSMASTFRRKEVVLPYHPDDVLGRLAVDEFAIELRKWRPGKRGTELVQDRVMSSWFVWILWQLHDKVVHETNTSQFERHGLQSLFTRSERGLIVPVGGLNR
jgi:hypothetical protein